MGATVFRQATVVFLIVVGVVVDQDFRVVGERVIVLVVEPGAATIRKATTPIGMDKAGGERLINSIDQLWLTIKPKPKPKPEPEKGEKK